MTLDTTSLVGIGAIGAVIVTCWNNIKGYAANLYRFFVVEITTDDGRLQTALIYFSMVKCKAAWYSPTTLDSSINYHRKKKKSQLIPHRTLTNKAQTFWYNGKPLSISNSSISFYRGLFDKVELMREITTCFNEEFVQNTLTDTSRFFVKRFKGEPKISSLASLGGSSSKNKDGNNQAVSPSNGETFTRTSCQVLSYKRPFVHNAEDIGQEVVKKSMEFLALPPHAEEALREIERWSNSKEWYEERSIPHKKGLLLYGPPGNGKSTFAKSIAMKMNNPLLVIDISNMNNDEFETAWESIASYSPCTVLIEDIDAVFDGRKNTVYEEGGLSFDCILNCLDGVDKCYSGVLVIVTTNNIDKVDPALGKPNGNCISTRPGRIDRAIEFINPSADGRTKIAKRILDIATPKEIDAMVMEGKNDSGAQFQERCTRRALELFWRNKE